MLDDLRRATNNQLQSSYYAQYTSKLLCDTDVNWVGWYRLFIRGQSVQMPDTCVDQLSCGTHAPLWLNGAHPRIEDGVVTRSVCGHWGNNCCGFQSNPIKVKACPGGYYVYEFVRPTGCYLAYCADVRNISINNHTVTPEPTLAAPAIFYPFGSAAGGTNNTAVEDGSSSVIQLFSPFLFFGRTYQQIYVNNNGHLTFNQASNEYVPYSFPARGSQDIIAGLWTNLDNSVRGVVSYHQYTSGNVLTRATRDINTHFPNLYFTASWVFVATWNKVAFYALTSTETSFQVVLISGSNFSFILMNYGDIAVTGHPVQAGYDTVSSTHYFVIPGSNNGSFISNLRNSSNVNVPGRWAFRVDGGSKSNKEYITGLQAKLSSFSDLTDTGNIQIVLQQIKQELVKYGLPNSIELTLRNVQKIKP
uniref:NIDO domain-containing protein n=1 Tax=Cyprinus carpio TaxID=7962 RepID=A0A8C2KN88_CYPCA